MTQRHWMILVGIVGVLTLAVAPAALADEYRLDPGEDRTSCDDPGVAIWEDYDVWEKRINDEWVEVTTPGDYPDDDDTVYIQNNRCVYIADIANEQRQHDFAHAIYVCGDGETSGSFAQCTSASGPGKINIVHNSTFTLDEDSTVNGEIVFYCFAAGPSCTDQGELRIRKDGTGNNPPLIITGNGGKVRSFGSPGLITAHPSCDGVGEGCKAQLRIHGETPGDEDTSMTLMSDGQNLEVSIKMNNRGDVLAQLADVHLTNERKDGNSGFWRASGGVLEVDKEVRGAGTWRTEGTNGIIQFDDECLLLSGAFHIPLGWLVANENVCTTGHMYFGEPDSNDEAAFIKVKAGRRATFHGDCE